MTLIFNGVVGTCPRAVPPTCHGAPSSPTGRFTAAQMKSQRVLLRRVDYFVGAWVCKERQAMDSPRPPPAVHQLAPPSALRPNTRPREYTHQSVHRSPRPPARAPACGPLLQMFQTGRVRLWVVARRERRRRPLPRAPPICGRTGVQAGRRTEGRACVRDGRWDGHTCNERVGGADFSRGED